MAKNRQVLIDLLRHLFIKVWKDRENCPSHTPYRATAMLMSLGIIKHIAFVTRLSVMLCKQSFDSVHDIEFENN